MLYFPFLPIFTNFLPKYISIFAAVKKIGLNMRHLKFDPSVTRHETDAVALYMKDIRKYPLLTFEEEVALAQRIQSGDQQALNRLVQCNLRFVVSVAKKYQVKNMELLDIISEGNIGLIKAAERFDPSRGFRFTSYAVCWIQQSIMLAISRDSRLIRLPANKIEMQHAINEFSAQFVQKEQRYPTHEEIAEGTGVLLENVKLLFGTPDNHLSLFAPVKDGLEDGTLIDVIRDEEAIAPDESSERESISYEINSALDILDPRERKIIVLSFGLDGAPERSMDEIASTIGICKERIRQIKEVALIKLKHSAVDLRSLAA